MSPFKPLGPRARWRIIYENILRDCDHGDVISYERLGEVLDLDPLADRHIIQMGVRRAAREYEECDKRALDAVPNVGYRVVDVTEHMQLARRQQRKSHRALKSGKSKVVNVDLSGIDPEVRKAFEVMANAFAMQLEFNRRMDVRQRNLEDATHSVTERQDRSEAEIQRLRERLAALEEKDLQD